MHPSDAIASTRGGPPRRMDRHSTSKRLHHSRLMTQPPSSRWSHQTRSGAGLRCHLRVADRHRTQPHAHALIRTDERPFQYIGAAFIAQ